jgi:hypothetical protein
LIDLWRVRSIQVDISPPFQVWLIVKNIKWNDFFFSKGSGESVGGKICGTNASHTK